jgi:putative transposase
LVGFLPVIRRTVTRTGFVIDHIHYYSNALKPWIVRRERLGKFVVRRDPRDLSRIWVPDPVNGHRHHGVYDIDTLTRRGAGGQAPRAAALEERCAGRCGLSRAT